MTFFSKTDKCRCGFDGSGIHRCHAGRPDPRTGEDGSRWCAQPGVEKLLPTNGSLAGMQLKFSMIAGCYCEEHWKELNSL